MRDRAHVADRRLGRRVRTLERALVVEDDLVLAARLRRHHRRLGARDELARVHRMLRPAREAHGDRDPARGVELGARDVLDEPPGEPFGVLRVPRGHHDRELLAAEPADDVRGPDRRAQSLGEAAEDLVAGAMSVDVVHALEVVDVEHEDGHRVVRATRVARTTRCRA